MYLDTLKKMPTALTHLGLLDIEQRAVSNYIFNLVLEILNDKEVRNKIKSGQLEEVLEAIKKL